MLAHGRVIRVGHKSGINPCWGRKNERYSNWARKNAAHWCCQHTTCCGAPSVAWGRNAPLPRWGVMIAGRGRRAYPRRAILRIP
ncbi:conserved hypothetical protein [Burkholderia pseudomallei 576]|nr:conserved hypothetical protein [Burkholderia pseudomallei 576]